jgi:putative ABC transport system substrate-binding protein
MERREFITLLVSAAVMLPRIARAQKPAAKIWRLGILQPGAPPDPIVDALQERLKELGYREGHNIVYEYRWAEGKLHRLTSRFDQVMSAVDPFRKSSGPICCDAQYDSTSIM